MDINFKKTYYIMKCGEVFFFYEFEFITKLFWSNTTLLSCDYMFDIPIYDSYVNLRKQNTVRELTLAVVNL